MCMCTGYLEPPVLLFSLFVLGFLILFFLLKSFPTARKGMERRKREFSRVFASEFNTVKYTWHVS